ncbi:unnamed protein product [Pleuronectes platessa]|uniref:Uncharacterized protein n=1 Tax=Pleuronectes platessa TaxID=8262 RepID=A0A9N7YP59_PLEPL|nr:unnamed protein product [Pleuronectes platessa]
MSGRHGLHRAHRAPFAVPRAVKHAAGSSQAGRGSPEHDSAAVIAPRLRPHLISDIVTTVARCERRRIPVRVGAATRFKKTTRVSNRNNGVSAPGLPEQRWPPPGDRGRSDAAPLRRCCRCCSDNGAAQRAASDHKHRGQEAELGGEPQPPSPRSPEQLPHFTATVLLRPPTVQTHVELLCVSGCWTCPGCPCLC